MATDDKALRLQCLLQACNVSVQHKLPKESIVGIARQFYDFVVEVKRADDEEDTKVIRPLNFR